MAISIWVKQPGSPKAVYVAPVVPASNTPGLAALEARVAALEAMANPNLTTHTYTQANHGFVPLNVVSWSNATATWVRASNTGPVDTALIVAVPNANSFTIGYSGLIDIAHPFGSVPALLYLGLNGAMTLTPPDAGQSPRQQIVIAEVVAAGRLLINPERRAV